MVRWFSKLWRTLLTRSYWISKVSFPLCETSHLNFYRLVSMYSNFFCWFLSILICIFVSLCQQHFPSTHPSMLGSCWSSAACLIQNMAMGSSRTSIAISSRTADLHFQSLCVFRQSSSFAIWCMCTRWRAGLGTCLFEEELINNNRGICTLHDLPQTFPSSPGSLWYSAYSAPTRHQIQW